MKKVNTVLFSYRRPEQTAKAIQRICNWDGLDKLYVSIDGLRANASKEEESWRSATIAVAEKSANLDSRIIPVVWDVNDGLTFHAMRIMGKVFEADKRLISLEEDNYIENEGLDFLARYTEDQRIPSIATAFSSTFHTTTDLNFRYTYFPEQWATSLTQEVFESFIKVWKDKHISRQVIQGEFKRIYPINKIKQEILVERWFRIYNLAVNDHSFGDALMSYAALRLGIPYVAPINSYVKDIGYEDPRGMHPRSGQNRNSAHAFKPAGKELSRVCILCENSTNQLPGLGVIHVAKYLRRRIF